MSGAATTVFSRRGELEKVERILSNYLRLSFSVDIIPGALMEAVLAQVRGAQVLRNYDFVDVVSESQRIGWQVKSTKATTPLTWKRAKIPDSPALIAASESSDEARQQLGDALIRFCNQHAHHSLKKHKLDVIGYSRLILNAGGDVIYFEKTLCTRESPDLFNPANFRWQWSTQKSGLKKEQYPRCMELTCQAERSGLHGTGGVRTSCTFRGKELGGPRREIRTPSPSRCLRWRIGCPTSNSPRCSPASTHHQPDAGSRRQFAR